MDDNAFGCEVMLLSWSVTSSKGAVIVLQLADEEDLERFKSMTIAKGRGKKSIAGQRLMAGFSEIGEDEKPAVVKMTAPLAKLAAMWCQDPDFHAWLFEEHTEHWLQSFESFNRDKEKAACNVILAICGIDSRRELDHDEHAARKFHDLFREPYSQALKALSL